MRKKIAIALPAVIILLVIGGLISAKGERQQPLKNNHPVYATGFDLSTNMKQSQWDEEVFYKVKINFPATEVISFYDKEFQARGFIPYAEDGYGTRTWEDFNQRTGAWEATTKPPARYIATWVDKEQTVRIVLFARYRYDYQNKDWDKILLVNCGKGKFTRFDKRPPTQ